MTNLGSKAQTGAALEQHRQWMADACEWSIAHKHQFSWAETRPMPINAEKYGTEHITTDCSGFVTLMAKWSGNPDPNGSNYDGYGYTGTMLNHLPHINYHDMEPGDLIVYGADPGIHVVVTLQAWNGNPLVASMGGTGDPSYYHHNDEMNYFGWSTPTTTLRLR
jgi:hypothetical protein